MNMNTNKNTYVWSAKNIAFIPVANITDYELTGWDISNVINVDDDVFDLFLGSPPENKQLGVDDAGLPAWVDKPPLTYDELVQIAEIEKQNLLLNTQQTISLWQTQLQLGIISDENKNKLTEWVKYIEAVQAVDTSAAPNITWPPKPHE
ncbi:tail fiber assembly protein [Plesiomonas sp.]|uniref:tail fiber assembly protein n=1 Tax=Plesiomonas sp. TaxID=2486279 RepID=UPI003F3A4B76